MSGAEVEKYYRDGHIQQIAEYCESDVLNTYRVWRSLRALSRRIILDDRSEVTLAYVPAREA